MGKVNVTHVAEQRGAISQRIRTVMSQDAKVLGVEVTDFQLTNIEYTKGFKTAVEQAVTARQMIETREREAAQEKQVAERNRIKAQGEADATLTRAQAEAKSIQLRGEAEAPRSARRPRRCARTPAWSSYARLRSGTARCRLKC
jgi:regulator of protease activity HflC (stomatin/prohibitin superfamily)